MVRMIAQAPALSESLTGQKVSDLMSRVPALADLVPSESSNGNGAPRVANGTSERGIADRV